MQYVATSLPRVRVRVRDISIGGRKKDSQVLTHSFATGPVMAEPFISPLGFTMTPALS